MSWLYSTVEMTRMGWGRPAQAGIELGSAALRWAPWAQPWGGRELGALLDLGARLGKSYDRPKWREQEWGHPVAPTVVWGTAFGALTRFLAPDAALRPKLLLVAPMSGHYPTLLRDTVKEMSRDNDVFVTDWANARDVPLSQGDFSLGDYVDFLRGSLRAMAEIDGRPSHAMSVCQPTVPMLAAASMMWEDGDPCSPQSLVMIGGPIDARKSPTATNGFALAHGIDWFESRLVSRVPFPYAGAGRRVYPGFLQHMGFVAMNPDKHAMAHRRYFESLLRGDEAGAAKHREFYDEYNAVMDLPAPYYLETVRKVFQDFDLPQGRLELSGRRVDPSSIGGALMTIEGGLDDISGAGQTHSAQALCGNVASARREELTVEGVGHYGVFSGASFRAKVAPRVNAFIRGPGAGVKRDKGARRA